MTAPQEAQSGTILVVDDEPFFADALQAMLQDEGFTMLGIASDGRAAVEAVRSLAPDVVLMDMRMPVMDGIEAARIIASESPLTQVLMLSAYDETALREEASSNGVYCYLVKGCRPELVLEMVRKALAHRANLARRIEGGAGA
jgi:DNA-binding NarL/FixJ family response regulator